MTYVKKKKSAFKGAMIKSPWGWKKTAEGGSWAKCREECVYSIIMASTRSYESIIITREKLITITREKILTAIDGARQRFNSKMQRRRVSIGLTIPPNYQYKISNGDTSLLWGEEKVADIDETLMKWPDRNLLSCCEGLDNNQFTVSVVVQKTATNTADSSTTTPSAADRDTEARITGAINPKANYLLAHESIRKRLLEKISLEIGRPVAQTSANRSSGDNSRINPLKSDPKLYTWEFSPEYPSFPDTGVSRWTLLQIEDCNTALDNDHLKVKKVDTTEHQNDELAPVQTPESKIRTARQKRADDTRILLHNTIVAKLGHEIVRRTSSNNHINPARDDPDPPNGYQWVFSEHYQNFPDNNQKRLKDWTIDEHEACNLAVQKGWLKVEVIEPGPTKLQAWKQRSIGSASPSQNDAFDHVALSSSSSSKVLVAILAPQASGGVTFLAREPSAVPSPSPGRSPTDTIVGKSERLTYEEQLDQILAEPISALKNAFGAVLKSKLESFAGIREELKEKIEYINRIGPEIAALKKEVRRLRQGGDRIAQAREEGRAEGQELAMRIMRETDEARKQTELRTHLMQIERAREEGRREGMRLAREEMAMDASEPEKVDQITAMGNISFDAAKKNEASGNSNLSHASATNAPNTGMNTVAGSSQATPSIETTQDSLRRRSRPPRPPVIRGFQAINHDSSKFSTNGINTYNKRAHDANPSNDSSSTTVSSNEQSDSKSLLIIATESEEDIYGVTPPPPPGPGPLPFPQAKRPRTVLSAVSSANRRHINEQWLRVSGGRRWNDLIE